MDNSSLTAGLDLPLEDIKQVINDFELLQGKDGMAKTVLHYCVDATEVVDYCFPVNPYAQGEVDMNAVSTDQTALHELFYGRGSVPVIVPQYISELSHYFNFARSNSESGTEALDMVSRLIEESPLESIDDANGDEQKLLDAIENNFQAKLAVWMGITSIGLKRFDTVIRTRLAKVTDLGLPFVKAFIYRSKLATDIFELQERAITEREQDPKTKVSRLNAARVDAVAIDWLLQLNAAAMEAAANGGERHLFLYVSSAPKTKRIFEHKKVASALPMVKLRMEGEPEGKDHRFPIWRSRKHLHLMALAIRNAAPNDYDRIIDSLRDMEWISSNVQWMGAAVPTPVRQNCESCILHGGEGSPGCNQISKCQLLANIDKARSIQEKAKEEIGAIPNLGLMARIKSYGELLKLKPAGKKDVREYIKYLTEVVQRPEIPDAAIQRIADRQNSAQTQTAFATALLEDLPSAQVPTSDQHLHLPDGRPFLADQFAQIEGVYKGLAQQIFDYHRAPREHLAERQRLLDSVMDEFLKMDEAVPYPGSGDHELVRCLIYLSFGGKRGEEDALTHARRMMKELEDRKEEFLKIVCLSALGARMFLVSLENATQGVATAENDWFFFHIRAVTVFTWYEDEKARPFCPAPITSCISDLKRALVIAQDLAKKGVTRPLALITNNLTYFHSASNEMPTRTIYDLQKANDYFELLESVLPQQDWEELPSFLHTKANLYLQQFIQSGRSDTKRLSEARLAIDRALHADANCRAYSQLKEAILTAGKLKGGAHRG